VKSDLSDSSEDPVTQLGGIPFDLNINPFEPEEEPEDVALFNHWRDSATEEDFWAAYLIGAYQPYMYFDNDYDAEEAVLGYTNKDHAFSILFRETIWDTKTEEPTHYVIGEEDLWRVVGLHEVGHQFGLDHDVGHGTIMDYSSMETEEVEELIFSPKGLLRITERDYPRDAD
jgi:hypothetical protein